ncbi:thiamine phosphate synthase [Celerinatantimonas sp. YJH-8]|uniref:thiamine phosphate synthase n=1 Tax=Celerinatantimonas sp. YJH-8 TaxID=3228714 RepID=UPI0038BFCB15
MKDSENQSPTWIIAAQDSSGGAGIVADLLTMHDLDVTPSVVITALTAQNSQRLLGVEACSNDFLALQLEALAPLPPRAIKIGMIANAEQVRLLTRFLASFRQHYPLVKIVIDPVLVTSSGYTLAEIERLDEFKLLFAQADLVTPNASELATLTGRELNSPATVRQAAMALVQECGCAVLAKGGHSPLESALCCDLICTPTSVRAISCERIDTAHSHGTGCSLSSAIAAMLARGESLVDAITLGKAYVTAGLRQARAQQSLPGAVAHVGWPVARDDYPRVESGQSLVGAALGLTHYWPEASTVPLARCRQPLGLYPVVDSVDWIERLLKAGVKTIQLRIKDPQDPQLSVQIARSVALSQQYQAQLFINDYWQLAIQYGAYGVHLGQNDIEAGRVDIEAIAQAGLRLGISTHGYYELMRALQLSPSYVAMGHVFATQTKAMATQPLGLSRLARYCALVGSGCPIVAIGGINRSNAESVLEAGADSLAIVSAITASDHPEQVVRELMQIIGE